MDIDLHSPRHDADTPVIFRTCRRHDALGARQSGITVDTPRHLTVYAPLNPGGPQGGGVKMPPCAGDGRSG
ncbi:MAG: hypothetical protein COB29_15810 [Sulfitobacter sp.]|jgi:hypothetical protein|nr:hypothetical protein [Roseobacter sp.]PHR00406.1 MAG: hypothetical protein COB29_15810 [Sulfitobacter sp.]